jgi:hypothetical protein
LETQLRKSMTLQNPDWQLLRYLKILKK